MRWQRLIPQPLLLKLFKVQNVRLSQQSKLADLLQVIHQAVCPSVDGRYRSSHPTSRRWQGPSNAPRKHDSETVIDLLKTERVEGTLKDSGGATIPSEGLA